MPENIGDIAKAQSIDFVEQFSQNVSKLVELIGTTRKIPMAVGSTVKTYKKQVTKGGKQAEKGALIPLSKVDVTVAKSYTLEFDSYRKVTPIQDIQQSGMDVAVGETDDALLKEIQKDVRAKFFTFLQGEGNTKETATTFQGALAKAWGKVQTLFEDDGVNTIAFVNPLDVADYLANANVTTQSAFGMTFISGFTGVTIITNTNVPVGKMLATAPQNVCLYFAPISGGEVAKAFTLTSDETGLIGVAHTSVNNTLSVETVVTNAIMLIPERMDGIVEITIGG